MISHVCKSCGITFTGGPRASFCLECRAERDKQAVKKCRNLAKKIILLVKLTLPISVSISTPTPSGKREDLPAKVLSVSELY
nr:MAG TPA: zinc-ribbon containing domain protein [Caudoviricetes sp.]